MAPLATSERGVSALISDLIEKNTKLYKFLSLKKTSRKVKFDESIWNEAISRLADFNCPEYFFDFEDRLIEEIVLLILDLPSDKAKAEMIRIQGIVDKESDQITHTKPFVQSIRSAVAGAVAVGLKFLA